MPAPKRTVGAYEAKTHLSQLLDEVAQGASITITKRGVPIAILAPPPTSRRMTFDEIAKGFEEIRKHAKPLGELTIRDLIEEGRRY
jgi:prevent-host-death family protein